jgi:hypothetical protein
MTRAFPIENILVCCERMGASCPTVWHDDSASSLAGIVLCDLARPARQVQTVREYAFAWEVYVRVAKQALAGTAREPFREPVSGEKQAGSRR